MEKDNKSENSNSSNEEKKIPDKCLVCHLNPVNYVCFPCKCPTLCNKCAMKQATGGKCKTCKEFFSGLQRINTNSK